MTMSVEGLARAMTDSWDYAIEFAERRFRDDDADWQEVQFDLLNDSRFADLFDLDGDPDGAEMDTMAIIRQAEERAYDDGRTLADELDEAIAWCEAEQAALV